MPAPIGGATPYPRYDTLRFRTLGGLSTALTWLLGASAVSAVALAVVCGNRISKINAFEDNQTFATARDFRDAECGDINGRGRRIEARELQGLGVDAAKDALRRAGYSPSRSIRIDRRQYDIWSSYGRGDTCVGFTSYNGRVTDARRFSDREC